MKDVSNHESMKIIYIPYPQYKLRPYDQGFRAAAFLPDMRPQTKTSQ
jgi:hypothetical protein